VAARRVGTKRRTKRGAITRTHGTVRKADRVGAFIKLMLSGQYIDGRTPREKASEFGVSVSCAQKDAAEASRYVTRACGSVEAIRARLVVQLQGIAQQTSAERPRAAVAAIKEQAIILGLHKHAVELSGPDGTPLVAGVVVLPTEHEPPKDDDGRAADSVAPPSGTTD
jgi:hypothetical protein